MALTSNSSGGGASTLLMASKAQNRLTYRLRKFGRRALLLFLGTTFLLLSILIVVAHQLSVQKDGFVVLELKQTVYTYIPTLVLLLLTALWRHIDHSYKRAAPWVEMRKGAATASKSVLLDYISTMQIVALPTSARNGHMFVASAIVGFLLLKAVTIASTGLLLLQNRTFTSQRTVRIPVPYPGAEPNVGTGTGYTAYANLVAGPTEQFGVSSDCVYPIFEIPEAQAHDTTFSIVLDALCPIARCDTINNVTANITVTTREARILIDYSTPSFEVAKPWLYTYIPVDESQPMPFRVTLGNVAETGYFNTTYGRDEADWGYPGLVLAAEFLFERGDNGNFKTLINSAGALCQNSYVTGKVNVSGTVKNFPSGVSVQRLPEPGGAKLPDLSDNDFQKWTMAIIASSPHVIGPDGIVGHLQAFDQMSGASQRFIQSYGNGTSESMFDEDVFLSAASATFMQTGLQILHLWLQSNQTIESNITVQTTQTILHVTTLSSWLMVGGFLATIAIAIFLCFHDATLYAKRSTESILAMARLAFDSHSLCLLHVQLTEHDEKETKSKLRNYHFYTAFAESSDHFGVVALSMQEGETAKKTNRFVKFRKFWARTRSAFNFVKDKMKPRRKKPKNKPADGWWKQMTFSTWFISLMFLYSIAIITVLEILQQLSDKRNGIATIVSNNDLAQTALSRYLPALVVLLLATMYNCLEFNILLLNPYHHMRRTVKFTELDRTPPVIRFPAVSLWDAVIRCDFAILGASTAAFIGTLLTIVVSGLYTIDYISRVDTTTFNATGIFNASSAGGDGGAINTLGAIENLNISWPLGTYDELVAPIITLSDEKVLELNESTFASIEAYVYRPELICDKIAAADFTVTIIKDNATDFWTAALVSVGYTLPPACQKNRAHYSNSTNIKFEKAFRTKNTVNGTYVAGLLDLHVASYSGTYQEYDFKVTPGMEILGEQSGMLYEDNPAGCPSLVLMHGYVSESQWNSVSFNNNYHVALPASGDDAPTIDVQVCYQEISRINAKMTARGEGLSMDPILPSDLDEKSMQKLVVPSSFDATAFPFRIQSALGGLNTFNADNPFKDVGGVDVTVDPFFLAALYGRKPLSTETLRLAPNSPSDQALLQESMLSVYRNFMAQSLSLNARIDLAALSADQLSAHSSDLVFSGTISNSVQSYELRIVQHKTQKIILQSMIAYMILAALLALWIMRDMRRLIRANQNPCTIWGGTALWAGSHWCTDGNVLPQKIESKSQHDESMSTDNSDLGERNASESAAGTRQQPRSEAQDSDINEVDGANGQLADDGSLQQADRYRGEHNVNPSITGSQYQAERIDIATTKQLETVTVESAGGKHSWSTVSGRDTETLRFRLAWWDSEGNDQDCKPQASRRYGIDVVGRAT